ncbi:hypothetical protein [Larkinella rosea]|uniref:Uncharacterized protein n=1 Tax=Larkinella rosea TaxID=2025312 RepID=A0A3P1BCL8_9BACT|nr:hypothetical protein [Larkinella rosea]RRA98774.1 hypothetical protein EHT25_27670 [Larkinella rosea]
MFGFAMGLLDLDKIIIKRTILGIRCNSCGGNLVLSSQKTVSARIIRLVSFGSVHPKCYECEQCQKRYLLL